MLKSCKIISRDFETVNDAVPAFGNVIDVPLVVRDVRQSRKQVMHFSYLKC